MSSIPMMKVVSRFRTGCAIPRRRIPLNLMMVLCVALVSHSASAAEPVVPPGFTIEKVAGYPLIHRPIFACLDEAGDLYVGESSGENLNRDEMLAKQPHWITRLEDTNGDGVYDKSVRFVENITLPQGCLWYRGSLYVTCPPGIWKFTDTDGDGKADEREEILTGFGFSGNACDTHGPFLSPSGRLYIVQGRHGHEFRGPDGTVYSKGKAGRIYSCTPDGKDVRVHAGGGFDNPVEVDFTELGACIGTANIVYRDRGDCILHWVEGGVYPREDQADAVAEFKWTGGLMGPVLDLGHIAISGIARYRGQQFGPDFKDRWFFTEFNTHRVRYVDLTPAGSTFTATVHDFLHCDDADYHPTDVFEDTDGSLLVLNTGGWFRNGCPTSRIAKPEIYGSITRIRKGPFLKGAKVNKSGQLPASKSFEELVQLLQSESPSVREQTLHAIRSRADLTALAKAELKTPVFHYKAYSFDTNPKLMPIPVFAALLRGTTEDPEAYKIVLNQLLNVPEWHLLPPENHELVADLLQIQLLHARDLVWEKPLTREQSETLLKILVGTPPQVFRAGMEFAATRCLDRATPVLQPGDEALHQFLESTAQQNLDSTARGCLVYALIRMNQPQALQAALKSESPAVQEAALIALDQLENSPLTREMVTPLLSTEVASLQQVALEIITRRPGWGKEVLSGLQSWLEESELPAERAGAVKAFLQAQLSDPAIRKMAIELLARSETIPAVQQLIWESINGASFKEFPSEFQPVIHDACRSTNPEIQIAAIRFAAKATQPELEAEIQKLAADDQQQLNVRSEAVITLAAHKHPLDEKVYRFLLTQLKDPQTSFEEKTLVARALGVSLLSNSQLSELSSGIPAAGPLALPSLVKAFAHSTDSDVGLTLVNSLQSVDSLESIAADELASLLRKYPENVRAAAAPLFKKLGVDPQAQEARLKELAALLQGGDAEAGRLVFFGKKAACSSCHAIGPQGGNIGPHLSTIGASRSPQDLLEAIVFPSASFVNGYRPTMVVTEDGRLIQGVISAETTQTITLKTRDLQVIPLRRDEIDEMKESSTSIMPTGLDRQLNPKEFQDLLAFLLNRK